MGVKTIHMPSSDVYQRSQAWKESVLGAICFVESLDTPTVRAPEILIARLQAPILAGADLSSEMWLSQRVLSLGKPFRSSISKDPVSNGSKGAIQYRFDNDLLFGVICIPELGSLQHATEAAYREVFALMKELDYPHVYRFWNYMADINGVTNGLERYRQFNVGRKDAYLACNDETDNQLPAACALGLIDGPLTIAFLSGRQAAVAIENPRQVNAYEYPEEYGPRTPSFSRATLLNVEQNAILFISGTASIVGHQTLHPLDVVAQTRETLVNLEVIIAEANRQLGKQEFDLHSIYFRVYIRHASDLTLVRDEMERYISGEIKAVYIQADICRRELLLEIEATAGPMLELA
jgi:chorismate lyase/3-hydroxybenzoate synthase